MNRISENLRRGLAFMAALVILVSCPAEYICLAEGEGTAPVITISTPGDFAALAKNCVYDSYSRGMQVTLLNDIDMSGTEFEPMKIFCGTFEGGGHRITNIDLNFDGSAKGLCFELGEGGEIRNLNISGKVKAKKVTDGAASISDVIGSVVKNAGISTDIINENSISVLGGIVGKNQGRVINCSFDGEIEGDAIVGGIVGQNEENGYIEACYNVSSVLGNKDTGGVVGKNYGWVKSSKNSGKVNSSPVEESHNIGGICGINDGVLENCLNDAEIGYKNVGINIGGIVGNQSGCVIECQNIGDIFGSKSVGGIFGRFEPYTDISIEDLDRVKDDVNEIRENVKSDIDNSWNNTINDIDSLRDRLNNDINGVLDRFGFFGGGGLLSNLLGLSGTKSSLSGALDSLTSSQTGLLDAIRDRISSSDSGSLTGLLDSLSDSAREISDDLGGLSESGSLLLDQLNDETKGSLGEALDSINNTIDTANRAGESLNDVLQDVDNLITDANDAYNDGDWQTLSDRLDSLDGRLDYIQDTMLDPISSSITSSLNAVTRTLNSIRNDSNDIADAISGPLKQAETILKNAKAQIDAANEQITKIITDIKQAIEKVKDILSGLFPTAKPKTVGSVISDTIFMTAYADEKLDLNEDEIKDTLKNLTSVDIDISRNVAGMNTDDALVMYCVNSGEVTGEKDLGGIGGTIGIESAVKYGNNVTLPSGKIITPTSIVKAVVNGCISEGEVFSRNGYGGGVVGDASFGIIKNSVTETNITSDEGGYVGGIAGYSKGKIYNCAAISDLKGSDHVGGIAGEGDTIATCYALPRIDGVVEKSGAITGTAGGVVQNNYFIKEGLSGIDGTDYEGKAVALDYTEMTGADNIPEKMTGFSNDTWYMGSGDIFLPQNRVLSDNSASNIGALIKSKSAEYAAFHFKVKFDIDEETVKEFTVDYNTVLNSEEIPDIEPRDGYCPQWDKDTSDPIRRNTIFKAEYLDAVKTLGTAEEPPLLLVEGNFKDGSEVHAWEADSEGEYSGDYKTVAAYEFEITPEYSGKIKVHIRDKDEDGNCIGIVINGKTKILDAERDGSYLVFETDRAGQFTVLHRRSNIWKILGILLLAFGLLILIGVTAYKRSGMAKTKPKDKSPNLTDNDAEKNKIVADGDAEKLAKAKADIKEPKQRERDEISTAKEKYKKTVDK